MQTKTGEPGITFAVEKVERAKDRLATSKTERALALLLGDDRKIEACSGFNQNCINGVAFHPLIAAAHFAFSQHRPLCLSPDMIWVTIVQGLGRHITNNSELLRHLFVSHQGKQILTVGRDDLLKGTPENAWDSVIHSMSAAVRSSVGARYDQLISDFSTTQLVERTACEVALLDAFQPYFEYQVYCICGIPEITLEGTPADWQRMRAKIEYLSDYQLDWWIPHLRKLGDEFVKASQGEINLEHWSNIYKRHDAYGYDNVNGWIIDLIPYLENKRSGDCTYKNPLLARDPDAPLVTEVVRKDAMAFFDRPDNVISSNNIPSGVSQAPFKINYQDEPQSESMEFLGGFLGVTQDPDSGALRPQLGWAVRKSSALDQLYSQLAEYKPTAPLDVYAYGKCMEKILEETHFFGPSLPGDLLRFYKICNGVTLGSGKYTFLPFEQVRDCSTPISEDDLENLPEEDIMRALRPGGCVKFCEFQQDQSFVDIELFESDHDDKNGCYRVVRHFPDKSKKVVAWSFKEFVEMCLKDA